MAKRSRPARALVVTAHPDQMSATVKTAHAVSEGLRRGGLAEVVHYDILANGFDPTFKATDLAAYRGEATELPEDVRLEQGYLEQFDLLVLVFPVYWASMPGNLKGWIDRVFTPGWAYENKKSGAALAAPRNLYFFPIGAVGERTYIKHGYLNALYTQLVDGTANYMGAASSGLTMLYHGESEDPVKHLSREIAAREAAEGVARQLAAPTVFGTAE